MWDVSEEMHTELVDDDCQLEWNEPSEEILVGDVAIFDANEGYGEFFS